MSQLYRRKKGLDRSEVKRGESEGREESIAVIPGESDSSWRGAVDAKSEVVVVVEEDLEDCAT